MEINGEDGSKLVLKTDSTTVFGRGLDFGANDRTVSHRHIFFETKTSDDRNDTQTEPRVSFEVIGRNPIWVRRGTDGEIKTFRRSEKGEMALGDWFCVAGETPIWFSWRKADELDEMKKRALEGENVSAENLGSGFDLEDIDVSEIDPVKEFGFLVIGHEFDCYAKKMICHAKKWNWFLEEPRIESEDDEDFGKKQQRSGVRRKRKKDGVNDDEDWTGESEDEKERILHKSKECFCTQIFHKIEGSQQTFQECGR